MFIYNASWSKELQDAERRRYRAECRVRCLESSLDRIDPNEFDWVMDQLEAAIVEVQAAAQEAYRLQLAQAAQSTP